jgi:EmrB/QacA subfamily drug resistance transporter
VRGATLAVASAATALLLLDVTVVNVALPAIRADLDASFDELQWVIDAYALALASTLLALGAAADRIGRRRVFLAGLAVFAAASAACAAAPNGTVLDVARAAQGIGAAAMFATSLALLAEEYRGADRGFAFGVWGAVSGAALALGPLVGGGLVDTVGWEWAFLINVPLCALLAALTLSRVRESRDADAPPPDLPGAALFTAAAFLVVYGLIRDRYGFCAAGAGLAVLFIGVERSRPHPMLDPRLFRRGEFTGTALVAFAQSFALYPMFLFLAVYMQETLGYTAWETGLRLLPVTLVLFAVAPLSGRLTARVPLRVPMCLGLVLIGAGLLLMRRVGPGEDWTALLPGFVVGGAGIGTISPALAAAMVSVLSVEQSGVASGVNNTFRQLGISVGIAALGAVFEARDVIAGLDAIFLFGALVALVSAPVAYRLLDGLRA